MGLLAGVLRSCRLLRIANGSPILPDKCYFFLNYFRYMGRFRPRGAIVVTFA